MRRIRLRHRSPWTRFSFRSPRLARVKLRGSDGLGGNVSRVRVRDKGRCAADGPGDVCAVARQTLDLPAMPFSGFGLDPSIARATRELGFIRPTPIQKDAIPPALAGRDVLGCAMTGSGKSAAFLLPTMQRLLGRPRGTTRALVMTPTRELAAQIHAHLEELAVHTRLTGASVFGGVGMGPQEHAFRSGVDVIIATPGRLLDHFRHPYARLASVEILV